MSKFSQKPIYLPQSLKIEVQKYLNGNILWLSGPNATLVRYIRPIKQKKTSDISFEMNKRTVKITKSKLTYSQIFYNSLKKYYVKKNNEYMGLLYGQVKKSMLSILIGYKKYLQVRGVGYKFLKKNRHLTLHLGYSHPINILVPSNIQSKLNKKNTVIKFNSYNDTQLFGFISRLRNYKKPDVYKGKGIRYKKEILLRKEGKKKKTF